MIPEAVRFPSRGNHFLVRRVFAIVSSGFVLRVTFRYKDLMFINGVLFD